VGSTLHALLPLPRSSEVIFVLEYEYVDSMKSSVYLTLGDLTVKFSINIVASW